MNQFPTLRSSIQATVAALRLQSREQIARLQALSRKEPLDRASNHDAEVADLNLASADTALKLAAFCEDSKGVTWLELADDHLRAATGYYDGRDDIHGRMKNTVAAALRVQLAVLTGNFDQAYACCDAVMLHIEGGTFRLLPEGIACTTAEVEHFGHLLRDDLGQALHATMQASVASLAAYMFRGALTKPITPAALMQRYNRVVEVNQSQWGPTL